MGDRYGLRVARSTLDSPCGTVGDIPPRKGSIVLLRKPLLAVAIGVGGFAFATEIAACSSTSATPSGPDAAAPIPVAGCTDGGLTVAFNPMYSAYIEGGVHTFTIPAVVRGSNGSVTWSADSTMVGMQVDKERPNEVLIQTLNSGNVVINVASTDGKCGSALLFISAAADSDWKIGSARYNDGQSLHLAAAASAGTGSPLEMGGGSGPACTNCHGETATNSAFTDVSHTPEQTGGFSDEDLLGIILRGEFPDGGYFDKTIVPYANWHVFHRWVDISADQQKGIITYLRSLTPSSQKGEVNFNAFDLGDSGSGNAESDATVADAGSGDTGAAPDSASDATADAGIDAAPVEDAGLTE